MFVELYYSMSERGTTQVSGYVRSNGTVVAGYTRHLPSAYGESHGERSGPSHYHPSSTHGSFGEWSQRQCDWRGEQARRVAIEHRIQQDREANAMDRMEADARSRGYDSREHEQLCHRNAQQQRMEFDARLREIVEKNMAERQQQKERNARQEKMERERAEREKKEKAEREKREKAEREAKAKEKEKIPKWKTELFGIKDGPGKGTIKEQEEKASELWKEEVKKEKVPAWKTELFGIRDDPGTGTIKEQEETASKLWKPKPTREIAEWKTKLFGIKDPEKYPGLKSIEEQEEEAGKLWYEKDKRVRGFFAEEDIKYIEDNKIYDKDFIDLIKLTKDEKINHKIMIFTVVYKKI